MLLFTPAACGDRDPFEVLDAVLPFVDVVQVRPKPLGASGEAPCEARDTFECAQRVIERVARARERGPAPLVLVDDRVDVAAALRGRGCDGVHVGQHDTPADVARAVLGPDLLLGLSTHDADQVVAADEDVIDYLGFGPIHATDTKGYARGLGAEACWMASQATSLPVFAIGGITLETCGELARVGRAAVASAVLGAADPARAARELRALLADSGA